MRAHLVLLTQLDCLHAGQHKGDLERRLPTISWGGKELQGQELVQEVAIISLGCTLDWMAHSAKFFRKPVIARVKCMSLEGAEL